MAKKTTVKKADAVKVEVKEVPKTEVKAEVKEAPKAEVKAEAKEAPKAEVKAEAKEAPKAEAKKAPKADAPAKKAAKAEAPAKKAAKKTAAKASVYVQYAGSEKSVDEIVEAAKAAATVAVKEITVYVKPEDNAAYYVINGGEEMGKIIL